MPLSSPIRHLSHQKNKRTINPSAKYRKNTSEDQSMISLALVGYCARDVSVMSFNLMTGGYAQCLFPTGYCCHVPLAQDGPCALRIGMNLTFKISAKLPFLNVVIAMYLDIYSYAWT